MKQLFLRLLNHSLQASALILAVILLRLLFRKLPKSPQCLLWAVVALRLALPFSLESAWSLLPTAEPIPAEVVFSAPVPEAPVETTTALELASKDIPPEAPIQVQPATDPWKIASYIWAVGVAAMMAMGLLSYLRLKRTLRVSIRLTKNICLCDSIPGPFVLGLVHPKIYLPSGLDEFSRGFVLAHEEAHLKHRDPWWKLLGYILLCVYWFQPTVWVGWWLFCRDLEMGCDERAVAGMTPMQKKTYACTLLRCAAPKGLQYLCPVAFGQNSVKSRVKNVLTDKKTKLWLLGGAAVLAVIVCSLFLTTQKTEAAQPPEDTTASEPVPPAENTQNTESVTVSVPGLPDGYRLQMNIPWEADILENGNPIGGIQGALLPENSNISTSNGVIAFDLMGINMVTADWIGGGTEWTIREPGGEQRLHSLVYLNDRIYDTWFSWEFAKKADSTSASLKETLQNYLMSHPDLLDLSAKPVAQRITAQGAALYDLSSGDRLFSKNETASLLPGRWNRVAFAAAILDQNPDLDAVPDLSGWTDELEPAQMAQDYTLRDHLYNLLFGRSALSSWAISHSLTENNTEALALTNTYLQNAGCTNTYFDDIFECTASDAHTTVQDIGRLLTRALSNETFREIWNSASYQLPGKDTELLNNNLLLSNSVVLPTFVDKRVTGGLSFTTAADPDWTTAFADLACTAEKNGHTYLCVVQSANRAFHENGWTVLYWGNAEEAKLILDTFIG